MINLYLLDYDKEEKNNGLNTYITELGAGLMNAADIQVNYVWLNAVKHKTITKEKVGTATHLYIPSLKQPKVSPADCDFMLAGIIAADMLDKENVLVHFNWINHVPIAWHLKKKINCITILTKHCIPWKDFVTNNYPEFYRLNQALSEQKTVPVLHPKLKREKILYDRIDHLITVTNCSQESLVQLFNIPKEKISVVYNGLRPSHIKASLNGNKLKLKQKYGFNAQEQIIFYAGNVNVRKGVLDLVKAFERLLNNKSFENIRLVIAGPGEHSQVLKMAKRYWSKITLVGSLDKQTLYDFYALADIGVVPSYIEQCSYTAIEMMQIGLPVIFSDVDGLKEMLPEDCGIRVKVDYHKIKGPSLNQKDLIAGMVLLLKHPEKAQYYADHAKRHALSHFSADLMVQKTLGIYDKVLKEQLKLDQKKASRTAISAQPLVSIVMPCFNAEQYLKDCLDSVCAQTLGDFELIIINDGSVDDTGKIIKSYKDPRIIYCENRSNKGVSYSLNKGIKLAKGKYISRIDADDSMRKERLEKQVEFMEQNPDYVMVGGWHHLIDGNGLPYDSVENPVENEDLQLTMLFYNPFAHPVVTIRAELAKELLYDHEFKYCEDYDLWFRLAKLGKVKNLPLTLLNYRPNAGGLTNQNKKEGQQSVLSLFSRELDKLAIDHSVEELMLHAAIAFGYGKKYFNSIARITQLNNWVDKIFEAPLVTQKATPKTIKEVKKSILYQCYGLPKSA